MTINPYINSRTFPTLPPITEVRRFYVVANQPNAPTEDCVWTISTDKTQTGWETDMGCDGYGLPYEYAKFLCDAANEKLNRR